MRRNRGEGQVRRLWPRAYRRARIGGSRWDDAAGPNAIDVRALMDSGALSFVFQPIIDLRENRIVGFEGLTRVDPSCPPEALFRAAVRSGLQLTLELYAIRCLLTAAVALPDDVYVSVNAAPSTARSAELVAAVGRFPLGRLVLEITEGEAIADYADLRAALGDMRAGGLRLAVDDIGAGMASLQHLVSLAPDIIKLDATMTDAIDVSPGQRAMTRAITSFAAEMGAIVVAEGVETLRNAEELTTLGVTHGQGFALGCPAPVQT